MRFAAIIAIALLVFGCDRPAPPPAPAVTANPQTNQQPPDSHAVRFLALGDSYTIGQSVSPDDCWPNQLAKLLRQRGVDTGYPQIIARTGWTTGELSAAIDQINPKGPFNLVGLLIGVNDQFRGGTVEAYRPNFVALLERSISFAGGDMFVVSIPDYGVMPFAEGHDRQAIGTAIDAFNRVAAEECQKRGVLFIDITPISREATTQPDLGADDGLHPSGEQYALWVKTIDQALRSAGH